MNDYTYIPIESAYILIRSRFIRVELVREKADMWSVGIPALAGCVAWGRTKADALRNVAVLLRGICREAKVLFQPLDRSPLSS